jgi:hypothetical protein
MHKEFVKKAIDTKKKLEKQKRQTDVKMKIKLRR